MSEFASAGAIKATIDFDEAGLERAVHKAMKSATAQVSQQIDTSMAEVEGRITKGFKGLGAGLLGYLGISSITDALTRVGGYVVSVGRETEQALNMFQAVSGATGEQMDQVSEKAKALGSDAALAGVSAGDAALAMSELAKAGFSVEESMTASTGVLQLATAAQTDAATAASIAAAQISAFGLEASDAGKVADMLANAANITAADMSGMADALNQVGAVANASGMSLAETAGVVAMMADNAIVGSDAGTSLKAMLIALQAPSGEAASLMAKYGINVYNAKGEMKDLAGITAAVIEGTKGLTEEQRQQALATIFGSDALRTINVLMAEGADGVRELTEGIQKEGAAAALANANTQGFTGALDAASNIIEGVANDIYDYLAPSLEDGLRGALEKVPGLLETTTTYLGEMIDNLRPAGELVAVFMDALEPSAVIAAKGAFAALLGVTQVLAGVLTPLAAIIEDNEAAVRGVTTAVITAVVAYKTMTSVSDAAKRMMESSQVNKLTTSMNNLRSSTVTVTSAMRGLRGVGAGLMGAMGGPWGMALGAATIAIGAFAAKQADTKAKVDELRSSLDEQTGAITANTEAVAAKTLEDSGALAAAERLGLSIADVTGAAVGNKDATERLRAAWEPLAEQYREGMGGQTLEDFNALSWALGDMMSLTRQSQEEQRRLAEATEGVAFASNVTGHALGRGVLAYQRGITTVEAYGSHIDSGADSVRGMGREATITTTAVKGLNNLFVTGLNEEVQFEQAIDDAAAKIKELGKRALNAAGDFDLNRQAGRDLASALATVATESDGVSGGFQRARTQMIRMVRPLVENKAAAKALVDQFFQTQEVVTSAGNAAGGAAGKMDRLKGAADRLNGTRVSVPVETPGLDTALSKINNFVARAQHADGMSVGVPFVSGGTIRHATGGPVFGQGTGTSDDEWRRVSHGEHVFTAAEVKAAGGHGNIMRLRRMLATGSAPVAAAGGAPLVGSLDLSVGDRRDLSDALDETMFRLRQIRRGGKYLDN